MSAKAMDIHKKTIEAISALMILLCVYTATSKLLYPQPFYTQLKDAPVIGSYASLLYLLVPGIEGTNALLLLLKTTRRAGTYAFTFLMLSFTIYIMAILSKDLPSPCSCRGVIQQLSWHQHLVFNSCFIILGTLSIYLQSKEKP